MVWSLHKKCERAHISQVSKKGFQKTSQILGRWNRKPSGTHTFLEAHRADGLKDICMVWGPELFTALTTWERMENPLVMLMSNRAKQHIFGGCTKLVVNSRINYILQVLNHQQFWRPLGVHPARPKQIGYEMFNEIFSDKLSPLKIIQMDLKISHVFFRPAR